MQAWILAGIRVDIELAVALEVGLLSLSRAESPSDRDRAITFNRNLWLLVDRLAATAPQQDRAGLAAAAARLVRGQFGDFAETNRHYAGLLAGRAATTGSLRQLLSAWRDYLNANTQAVFGAWLLDRFGRLAVNAEVPLAA